MLEKMSDFFEKRLAEYDEHMLTNIESANEFYSFTAECMPEDEYAKILDLGCGTGLELTRIFEKNPTARVTGIDLSRAMLDELKRKLNGRDITLVCGSYFDVPFGVSKYDAAVSVESLHHFTKDEKLPLYKKLCSSLCDGGYFILTDYFALSDEEEKMHREELSRIKAAEGIFDKELYHYDTPLTVEHECEALLESGFASVEVIGKWGATHTLKAVKGV